MKTINFFTNYKEEEFDYSIILGSVLKLLDITPDKIKVTFPKLPGDSLIIDYPVSKNKYITIITNSSKNTQSIFIEESNDMLRYSFYNKSIKEVSINGVQIFTNTNTNQQLLEKYDSYLSQIINNVNNLVQTIN